MRLGNKYVRLLTALTLALTPLIIQPTKATAAGDLTFPSGTVSGFNNLNFTAVSATGITPRLNSYTVSGTTPTKIKAVITATAGYIKLTPSSNVTKTTGAWDGTGSSVTFTATGSTGDQAVSYIDAAISSLEYKGSVAGSATISIDITDDNGAVFASGTGANNHYYRLVSHSDGRWTTAKTAAESLSVESTTGGTCTGYLVTVNTSYEQTFLGTRYLSGASWMGANDTASEGTWRWVTDPDLSGTAQIFSIGNSSPVTQAGMYANWNGGEPNNSGGNEDYGQFTPGGGWNDLPDSGVYQYIAEFGSSSCTPSVAISKSFTASVSSTPSAPTIGALSTDNTSIGIIFNPAVDNGSLITKYQYSTDGGSNWADLAGLTSPQRITTTSLGAALSKGSNYSVIIRAVNALGNGTNSSSSSITVGSPANSNSWSGAAWVCPSLDLLTPCAFTGSNSGATSESHAWGSEGWGGTTVWYKFVPSDSGLLTIRASSTSPAGWDNTLHVTNSTDSILLASNDDSYGLDAKVSFSAVAGTTYYVALGSYSSGYGGNASISVSMSVPTAPTNPTATVNGTSGSATVSWTATNANIEGTTSYEVIPLVNGVPVNTSGMSRLTVSGTPPATTTTITGLTNGQTYTFKVRSSNANGPSEWSTETNSVTVYAPAQAPTLTKSQGDRTVTISFNEINGSGLNGGTFVRYEYQMSSGAWIDIGSGNSFTLSNLTNGTAYTFNVRAVTSVGGNNVSGVSGSITATPNLLPVATSIPTISGISRYGQQFAVTSDGTWTGGGISFTYQWQRANSEDGPFTDISGAINSTYSAGENDLGKFLRLKVIATNSTGPGYSYSHSSTEILDAPATINTDPAISGTTTVDSVLSVTPGTWNGTRNSVSYQWFRAGISGGTDYAIPGATGTTYTLTPDDAGRRIYVVETARNTYSRNGVDALSNTSLAISKNTQTVSNFVVAGNKPFSESSRSVTADNNRNLTVTFESTTPTVCSAGAATRSGVTSTSQITYLSAGTCTVVAKQIGTAGYLASNEISQSFDIETSTPSVVRNLTTSVTGTKITASWTAPLTNGGSAISSYLVTATAGANSFTCTTATTTCDIDGLTTGTTYDVSVVATNTAVGASSAKTSNATTAVRASIPAASVSTVTGNIPTKVTPKPVTSLLGEVDPTKQKALINSGVIAPPPAVPVINVSADLSSGSIATPTTVVVSQTVESGAQIDLAVKPPTDTPVGTPVYGTLILADGTTYDLGQIGITSAHLTSGFSLSPFTILPVGTHYVELRFGDTTTAQSIYSVANFGFTSLSKAAPSFNALSTGSQINIKFAINIVAGANGVPTIQKETPTPTRTPTPTPSATEEPTVSPTPTPEPSVQAQGEPQATVDARGLPVTNPLTDAPLAVAQTTLTAVALVAAVTAATSAASAVAAAAGAAASAGAAAGGAAGAASGGTGSGPASRSASSGSGSGGSSSSSGSSGSSGSGGSGEGGEGDDDASIEGVEFEHDGFEAENIAWGDDLKLWSIPVITAIDEPSHRATEKLAPITPLVSKLIADPAYLKAMLGSLSLIFPILGILLGLHGVSESAGVLLPPTAPIITAIAVVGVLDAFAGFIAMAIYTIGMILTAGVHNAADLRMLLGLVIIGFGPSLLASAFRGLRRSADAGHHYWWERLTDLAVAPFLGGWATKGMVEALTPLAGVELPIHDHANAIAWSVAIALGVRIILEEVSARYFPSRLNFIHPTDVPSPTNLQKVIALTLRAGVFFFVAGAFIGNSWHLYVGTLLFIAPSYLGLIQDKFPNYPKLYQILPAGLPGLAFTLLVASGSLAALTSILGETPDLAQIAFVVLPIPSVILSVLGMFGREPAEGDVRWYQRAHLTWLYRIGGVLMLAYTMHLTGVI